MKKLIQRVQLNGRLVRVYRLRDGTLLQLES